MRRRILPEGWGSFLVRVKICGLMSARDVLAAAAAGADLLGLVFAPGRHRLSVEQAERLADVAHRLEHPTALVGVFVNSPAEGVNQIARLCRLDYVQLSGDEDWDYCRAIKYPLIKAIRISSHTMLETLLAEIEAAKQRLGYEPLFLLDTAAYGLYGGTGRTFDWRLAGALPTQCRVLAAGGLTPQNVGRLIRRLRPWGVDVSSGVETDGRKDALKIESFIKSVRRAVLSPEEEHAAG